jgi:pimeloyl-ACP methyl ester carboxylesterase
MTATMDPREITIQANGLHHHLLEWDFVQTDTTLVIVHGFLDLAWSFELVAQKLAPHFHVVAPDLRGHGDSNWVGAGGYYYLPDYTADLARLLPQLARSRVYLVGHSMGATIATYYAGAFPDRVQKLALLEAAGPASAKADEAPTLMREYVRTVDKVRSKSPSPVPSLEAAAERLRKTSPRLDVQWAERLADRATREVRDAPPGSRLWKYDPLLRTRPPLISSRQQHEAFVRSIQCPVLLVDAADSGWRYLSEAERFMLYQDVRSRTLEASGHMLQWDQPEQLAKILLEFSAD